MSFSSEVKEELSKLSNLANKEVVKYEFLGYLATNHVQIEQEKQGRKLKFATENEYNINRFSKLLNNLRLNKYEIQIVGKSYLITVKKPELDEIVYKKEDKSSCLQENIILNKKMIKDKIEKQENLQKAFVRGAFLGSGAISNPQKSYHLEIIFSQLEDANFVLEILQSYNIILKKITKKQGYSIYAKDGEQISKFLAFVGANNSVLKFEEIRVYRDIRNNVNRKVNCETANLNKTINSALNQIEAIKNLQSTGELERLPEGLQEIAKLRLSNPEASLAELGSMLKKPIGKSGVNHRLKAIEKIACQFGDVPFTDTFVSSGTDLKH